MVSNFKYALFLFIVFVSTIMNCSRNVIGHKAHIEKELFSIVVQHIIKEESITTFIDPMPFKISGDQSDTSWEGYVNEPEYLLDERKKIIDDKDISEGSIRIYSTCPFPHPMVPPLESDEKQETYSLPEPCEKYLNAGLIKISLSEMHDQNGKNISYERRIRVIHLFNNGSLVEDYYLSLEHGGWKVMDKNVISSIFA